MIKKIDTQEDPAIRRARDQSQRFKYNSLKKRVGSEMADRLKTYEELQRITARSNTRKK